MKNNLAENLETEELLEHADYAQDYLAQTPSIEPLAEELIVPKGISGLEIKIALFFALLLFGLLLLNVHSDLKLSSSSRKTQDLNSQIQNTEVEIENLEQHVHELSRYDRIHRIAEEQGLELHTDNVRNLSPIE